MNIGTSRIRLSISMVVLTGLAGAWAAAPALVQTSLLDKARGALGDLGNPMSGEAAGSPSTDDIAAGLRQALRIGSERVVAQVGAPDGFNADPRIHIPLPDTLRDVQSALKRFGMSALADDLEVRLNRGAEPAAPDAKELFFNAIGEMTLDDARGILNGPKDAATQYFKGKMSAPLARRMAPIVDGSLADVGAIASYDDMMGRYKAIPFVPDVKADLTDYVVEKALDGIFHYIAEEEAAIRANPAARTTELLKLVFGS